MDNTDDERIKTSRDRDWVVRLENKLSDTKFRDRSREPTIYRVPDILKKVDHEAYEPLIVSLGPYHHDKPHLQAMNQLKWKYLKFVLEQNSGMVLNDYVDMIEKLERRARDAYSEEVKMSSESFVEMMLLDGCFVMLTITGWNIVTNSIWWTYSVPQEWSAIIEHNLETKISEESTLWTRNVVVRDIFMLENQLPFFLLETLYKSAFPLGASFRKLTFEFIAMHLSNSLELPSDDETVHHIIHFFHSCIDPATNHGNVRDAKPKEDLHIPDLTWIPSATKFNKAGIHFERKKRHHSFLDITFQFDNGKLEIPQLQMDELTNSLLRNLIAYEQCSMNSKFHVTSYMMLMDCLINTAAGVELLQHHEIIISSSRDSQEIATLFNKLGTYVNKSDDFYFKDVVIAMRKHNGTRYSKWRARLNHNYFGLNHDFFSNPWAVISLFGALSLFILTVIQSTFTILSYFRPPK